MPCELYSLEWCRRRRLPTINVALLVRERELESRRPGSHLIRGAREFYHNFPLMRSMRSANRPNSHLLRFTPDGTKLLGISEDFKEVFIYDYQGVHMATATTPDLLFSTLFPRCRTVRVHHPPARGTTAAGILARECCLVTADSRHLVACTAARISEGQSVLHRIQQNNESLPINGDLEDVRFYSIDLVKGELKDRLCFDFEIIHINQGVYLLDRTLAILSVQHQTIHVYRVDDQSGDFLPIVQIGPNMLDNDYLYLSTVKQNAGIEECFTGFRQRLLTFFYRESQKKGKVKNFLRNYSHYQNLKMRKIQMIGQELILVRMDSNSADYVFVLLEWQVGRIVTVFDNNCERLFRLFENFNESFRAGTCGGLNNRFPTSMEHSWYVRNHYEYVKSTKRNRTPAEVRQQFLAFLPYSCVGVPVNTPYLDPEMFTFEDHCLLNIERGRVSVDWTLRIFSRKTKLLHVCLKFPRSDENSGENRSPHHVRVIFHPSDPFAISVYRNKNPFDPLTTFHLPESYNVEIDQA